MSLDNKVGGFQRGFMRDQRSFMEGYLRILNGRIAHWHDKETASSSQAEATQVPRT